MLRFVARTCAALAAVLIVAIIGLWVHLRPVIPDAFYDVVETQGVKPGTLLKQEAFTRNLPAGTRGWRILYQSTRHDGSPAVASAIVVVPLNVTAPSPLIAWAHGTTGVARGCAPSLFDNAFPNIPAFPALFNEGWSYVATDYVGLGTKGGHAYLVGVDAAQNVLDSIRAARQVAGTNLDPRTLVWGHSQGGHSALWTGQTAAAYAPEITINGIAALAPASDLKGLMREGKSRPFGKIISAYVIDSYVRSYGDLKRDDLTSGWADLLAYDMASRCVGGYETLFSALEAYVAPANGVLSASSLEGPFAARLQQNTPTGAIATPVLIAQGLTDDLVFPDIQDAYVKARCASGQAIEYRRYENRDHLSLVAADSPLSTDLLAWSRARLARDAVPTQCPP